MEWWKFNGYGFFVWGSYLTAMLVVLVENAMLAARHRRARADAADREAFDEAGTGTGIGAGIGIGAGTVTGTATMTRTGRAA